MEYVSVLAGKPFTDHPTCTHPALAALARMINDSIADQDVRSRLALLAPDLIGVSGDPRMTHCVIASCLEAAVTAQPLPLPPSLRRLAQTSARLRRLGRDEWWNRVRLRSWELLSPPTAMAGSAFQFALERMRGLAQPERDARLSQLLQHAVAECRALASEPTVPARPSTRTS